MSRAIEAECGVDLNLNGTERRVGGEGGVYLLAQLRRRLITNRRCVWRLG